MRLGVFGESAPAIILVILLTPFLLVQTAFFTGWPRAIAAAEYSALTLGLFVLILAAVSSNLLKLKVAGVEAREVGRGEANA